MNRRGIVALVLVLFLSSQQIQAQFPGWQGLRVIEQKGRPNLMRAADLDGDGGKELIIVNSRSSRLDIYANRGEDSEPDRQTPDALNPNDLPLAPDFKHSELQLEHVPKDVLVHDLDGDQHPELVVLVSSPNQVLIYQFAEEKWTKHFSIDLLEGDIPTRREAMLLRPLEDGTNQLLISMDNGIQQLELKPGGRAMWFTPRERRGRLAWWLADFDGDGRQDLIEQTRESSESLRWYRATEAGNLSPAAVLHDRAVKDAEVLRVGTKTQLVAIDGAASGILRRYELTPGEKSPFGRQLPLALEDGVKTVWCGMQQDDQRVLVVADREAPRLLCYRLNENGWDTEQAYPALTDVQAMQPLASQSGVLLLWTKDAAELRRSRWEGGRLSYPEPWSQSSDVEDRKILALSAVGEMTWWVQKVGKDLDLYISRPDTEELKPVRFPGVGSKADQVLWIGGQRLLVKETHGRALKLIVLEGEKVKSSSPTHLKKATLAEFKLFAAGQEVRLGRLTDGVLQWLGEDLRSHEQIMLPQGQRLRDYVMKSLTEGWALQHDSPHMHRIEIDDSRLSRAIERIKVAAGVRLLSDSVLGMLLVGADRVTHLREGQSRELQLVDLIDERVAQSGGVRKTRFHRLSTTDIDGDGYDDLLLHDQLEHRLTVLGEETDHPNGTLVPKISWPVFDDKVYPYSNTNDNLVKEPRAILAADFDGDQLQDLAVLCHDRLLIYLAQD